jgi:hypothetical protein
METLLLLPGAPLSWIMSCATSCMRWGSNLLRSTPFVRNQPQQTGVSHHSRLAAAAGDRFPNYCDKLRYCINQRFFKHVDLLSCAHHADKKGSAPAASAALFTGWAAAFTVTARLRDGRTAATVRAAGRCTATFCFAHSMVMGGADGPVEPN